MVQVDKFKIRLSIPEDKKYLISWLEDPDVLKWFPMCNRAEIEDAVRMWMYYIKYHAVITALIDGNPCGMAILYIQSLEKLKHHALFAIIVDKEQRGKGIGTALINELFKMAKEQFHLEIIHLEVYEKNPAIKLYERLGFKYYGNHKKFLKDENGKYYDKILMQKYL